MRSVRGVGSIFLTCTAFVLIAAGTIVRTEPQQTSPQTSPQTPVFRSGADIVRLEVSVLDAHRRPVLGLTPEDFIVTEDGKPQPVVALSDVTLPIGATRPVWEHAATPDVVTNEVGDERLFAIVL